MPNRGTAIADMLRMKQSKKTWGDWRWILVIRRSRRCMPRKVPRMQKAPAQRP